MNIYTPQIAEQTTGVKSATLRYWEKQGILTPTKLPNGIKGYTESQLHDIIQLREEEILEKQKRAITKAANEFESFRGYIEDTYKGITYTFFNFQMMGIIFVGVMGSDYEKLKYKGYVAEDKVYIKLLESYAKLSAKQIEYKTILLDDLYEQTKEARKQLRERFSVKHEMLYNNDIEAQYVKIGDWTCNAFRLRDLIEMMGVTKINLIVEKDNRKSVGYMCTDNCLAVIYPILLKKH